MAIKNRALLKQYFETRDKPTQEQFADLIDSFSHKSESLIAIDSAEPADDPGAPQGSRIWVASTPGTYTDFPDDTATPIVIGSNEVAYIVDNGTDYVKVPIPLNLTNYYTIAQTDAGDAATLATANAYTDTKFLGVGSVGFQGTATISTSPGAHVAGRSWIAATTGSPQTFTNFGSVSIAASGVIIIYDDGVSYSAVKVSDTGDLSSVLAAGNSTTLSITQIGNGIKRNLRSAYYGTSNREGFSESIVDFTYDVGEDPNTVWMFGYNQNGGGDRINSSEPSLHMAMETNFYGDFEHHLSQFKNIDGTINYRPYSILINRTTGVSNHLIRGSQWSLSDIDGTQYLGQSVGGNFFSKASSKSSSVWDFVNLEDNKYMRWQIANDNVIFTTNATNGFKFGRNHFEHNFQLPFYTTLDNVNNVKAHYVDGTITGTAYITKADVSASTSLFASEVANTSSASGASVFSGLRYNSTTGIGYHFVVNDAGKYYILGIGGSAHSTDANTVYLDASAPKLRIKSLDAAGIIELMAGNSSSAQMSLLADGNLQIHGAGKGIHLRTPDGTAVYLVTIDNSGNLVTTVQP